MEVEVVGKNYLKKKSTNNHAHLKVFITFFIQTLQQNSICETSPTETLNIHSFQNLKSVSALFESHPYHW